MADLDRLYDRATAIRERRANGLLMPILETLSVRKHDAGRNELARSLTDPWRATAREHHQGLSILRADAFKGDQTALYNLAIEYRNRGDLRRYRYWLFRASKTSRDPYIRRELRFFETRFPHAIMGRYGRIRP